MKQKQYLMASPANSAQKMLTSSWPNSLILDSFLAAQQWSNLRNALVSEGFDIVVLPKSPEYCPGTVLINSAGLAIENCFIPTRFRDEHRAVEEPFFTNWFRAKGFQIVASAAEEGVFFNSADIVFSAANIWYGIGPNSSYEYKKSLETFFNAGERVVRGLELITSEFSTLDNCFCMLETGVLLWYPEAFSEHSREVLELWYGLKNIKVSLEQARAGACSSISFGKKLITPVIDNDLDNALRTQGITPIQINVSEFVRAGAGCRSLVLKIYK